MKKKKIVNYICLFIPIFILIIISLINMKIVGNTYTAYQNYFFKQALWIFLAFIFLIIIKLIKPERLFKYSSFIYYFNILLLILVLFFGKSVNGSKAWFDLHFFSFQPSELMKFSLTLYLCNILSQEKNHSFKNELKFIFKSFFFTLIPSLFVFLEPDTGAIIIYFIIMLGIIFTYKINKKWYLFFIFLFISLIGLFGYLYYFQKDFLIKIVGTSIFYRIDRLLTFVNKDSFQLDRALTAIGTSDIFSTNHLIYIPEAPTDFIIALSISNLGLISIIIILTCFLFLDIFLLYLFFKSQNQKYKMFLASFLMMFIFAQIQNIGMNLGLFPIIGLPLPFLSYGGTNIMVYFIFLGIIISNKKFF